MGGRRGEEEGEMGRSACRITWHTSPYTTLTYSHCHEKCCVCGWVGVGGCGGVCVGVVGMSMQWTVEHFKPSVAITLIENHCIYFMAM